MPERKGFYASLPQIGLSIGPCLASGVLALLSMLLSDAQFLAWAGAWHSSCRPRWRSSGSIAPQPTPQEFRH